jgi:hypothetical protein
MVGQEVHDPETHDPARHRHLGVAITAIHILSSASVLVAVPASELAERSGIADAIELVTTRLRLVGLGAFTGLLLAVGSDRRHQLVDRRRGACHSPRASMQ